MNSGTVRCITRTLSVVLASESAKKSQGYDALTIQNVKWDIITFIFCCNETFEPLRFVLTWQNSISNYKYFNLIFYFGPKYPNCIPCP